MEKQETLKVLIIGLTNSGKTLAANLLAGYMNCQISNDSDIIIRDFARSLNLDPDYVKTIKKEIRQELFNFARVKQKEDPSWPAVEQLQFANIITGTRNPDEIRAKRHLFDLIIWVNRKICKRNITDKLTEKHADVVVDNNGTIMQLRNNLISVVSSHKSNKLTNNTMDYIRNIEETHKGSKL